MKVHHHQEDLTSFPRSASSEAAVSRRQREQEAFFCFHKSWAAAQNALTLIYAPAKSDDITSSMWCHFVTSPPSIHPEAIVAFPQQLELETRGNVSQSRQLVEERLAAVTSALTGCSRLGQEQPIISGIKTQSIQMMRNCSFSDAHWFKDSRLCRR